MIRAGILSDTHLTSVTSQFRDLAGKAFTDCDVIFHAGDLTGPEIIEYFYPKTVYAVCGNMCSDAVRKTLPEGRLVTLAGNTIALCHGAGPRHNIEERLWARFGEADCIIYGHTHQPVCERKGDILFINPGSFQCSSPHGAPATYAILTIGEGMLKGQIHTVGLR